MCSSSILASYLLLSVASPPGEELKPRVFVHADPHLDEQDSQKLRDLTDSVLDLREQLQKRRDVVSAEDDSHADILVTILDRRIEVNRSGETKYFGYSQTHFESRYVLSFRLEAGGSSFESATALAGAFVTWKRVAGALAKDIEHWAREHRDGLIPDPPRP